MVKVDNEWSSIKEIDFELSSLCNAGCSVCTRRENGHFTNFVQSYWSLKEVQRVIDIDILSNLDFINICGNKGDGMANPEIVEIVSWFKEINPKIKIDIHTNGAVGNVNQYKQLAKLGVKMIFAVDGIGKKNELYRVNCKWNKLYENLISFSKNTTPEYKIIQFLMWAETFDQLLPIIDICDELEIGELHLWKPFNHGEETVVYDMKGYSTHVLTTIDHPIVDELDGFWKKNEFNYLREKIKKANLPRNEVKYVEKKLNDKPPKIFNPYTPREIEHNIDELQEIEKYTKQTCFAKNAIPDHSDLKKTHVRVFITHDKKLMPCCKLPTRLDRYIYDSTGVEHDSFSVELLNRMYEIGFSKFSLHNKTLREVYETGILFDFVFDDLENDNPSKLCKQFCGKCE